MVGVGIVRPREVSLRLATRDGEHEDLRIRNSEEIAAAEGMLQFNRGYV